MADFFRDVGVIHAQSLEHPAHDRSVTRLFQGARDLARHLNTCVVPQDSDSERVRRRAVRVALLVVACVLMSLLDLELTLLFTQQVGMIEMNPLARLVMAHQSPLLVVLYKIVTVGVGCGILYWARRLRYAEVATWLCFIALTALSVRWLHYAVTISEFTPAFTQLSDAYPGMWVKLDE